MVESTSMLARGFSGATTAAASDVLSSTRRKLKCTSSGSLPFKKRKLQVMLPETTTTLPTPSSSSIHHQHQDQAETKLHSSLLPSGTRRAAKDDDDSLSQATQHIHMKREDEKLAVLALISASQTPAAAAASSSSSAPWLVSSSSDDSDNHNHDHHPTDEEQRHEATAYSFEVSPLTAPRKTTSTTPPTTPGAVSPKHRSHLPRLDSPLPNGCHGRTSRNNSFCRRQPYKGGKYCKLHYQQYVLRCPKIQESPLEEKAVHSAPTASATESPANAAGIFGSNNNILEGAPALPNIQPQDKRYTGNTEGGEVRCQATTTRGRECAYIAVNGTKYCYLHADYDTNPPPRRGGASLRKAEASGLVESLSPSSNGEFNKFDSALRRQSVGHGKNGSKDDQTDAAHRRRRHQESTSTGKGTRGKNVSKTVGHSSLLLLSMVPTEEWAGKRVIVSTGPLSNRCGRVLKWGNGWVTVTVNGVGTHNRRSFELLVHPDQSGSSSVNEDDDSNNVPGQKESGFYFPPSHQDDDTDHHSNRRSFSSRDWHEGGAVAAIAAAAASLRPISTTSSEADDQESVTERLSTSSPSSAAGQQGSHPYHHHHRHSAATQRGMNVWDDVPRSTHHSAFTAAASSPYAQRIGSPFGVFLATTQGSQGLPPIVTPRTEPGTIKTLPVQL